MMLACRCAMLLYVLCGASIHVHNAVLGLLQDRGALLLC
jgi:hypothetical protein